MIRSLAPPSAMPFLQDFFHQSAETFLESAHIKDLFVELGGEARERIGGGWGGGLGEIWWRCPWASIIGRSVIG